MRAMKSDKEQARSVELWRPAAEHLRAIVDRFGSPARLIARKLTRSAARTLSKFFLKPLEQLVRDLVIYEAHLLPEQKAPPPRDAKGGAPSGAFGRCVASQDSADWQ